MSRGIIIFGPAGSGKTSLGKLVAEKLGFPYYDIDDYIWRTDTPIPYTQMYSREEKISRLMNAISQNQHFVMAGSMDSFNAPFVPLFDLAVHLTCEWEIRRKRLDQREYAAFGERIHDGGDMVEEHRRFLSAARRYDTDGSPSMAFHSQWADTLPCPVLRLDGAASLLQNAAVIAEAYQAAVLHLRPYRADDFSALQCWIADERTHALWCANHMRFPLTNESFTQKLEQGASEWGDQAYVCVDESDQPVGFCLYSFNAEKAQGYFKYVLVNPAQRGRGVGTQMIRLLIEKAFHHDHATTVRLSVFDVNVSAIRCYQKAGFKILESTSDAFTYQNESWGRIAMFIQKDR